MTKRWELITIREVERDEREGHNNNYVLEYKEWGYVVNHTIKFTNASLLRKRLGQLDEEDINYSYSIYKEVVE